MDTDLIPKDQAARLSWRCRRGLLELDIMLGRFIKNNYEALNMGQMEALDQLLALPDNQFLDLLLEREQSQDIAINRLLNEIRISQINAG